MINYEDSLHQEARDLMESIDNNHGWSSLLSLDEYLFEYWDDLSETEVASIKSLLDKFDEL